jgi:hypothetical protein
MKENTKVVTLSQINCPEEVFLNLERLHYEVVSHERILALTLGNETISLEGSFKTYYEDYMNIYKEYDMAKLELFNLYLVNVENIERYHSWEADFRTKTVVLYE